MSVVVANPNPVHHHHFTCSTMTDKNHLHSFSGITGQEIILPDCSELGHVHEIFITHCSFLDLHNHQIKGITGPPVWISETQHYHNICGCTLPCAADNHTHNFSGTSRVF